MRSTSPAGIPITVGPATGTPPPAVTGIVNSTVSVSAPATRRGRGERYAFDHWSDGGARTHGVPIASGATSVVATYTLTGGSADRSNTCSTSPAPVVPSGSWLPGGFGSAGDVDWYRFKLTATTRVRLVLGDLTAGGRMSLYSGCTKVLEVSDYGGSTPELIIRKLPPGSYAVRLAGSGGTASPTYSFLMQRMPNTVHVLSTRARTDAGVFRLTGEVFNNTSRWVGPVTVTARLYNSTGKLLTTRIGEDAAVVRPRLRPRPVQHRRPARGRLPPCDLVGVRPRDVQVPRRTDDHRHDQHAQRRRPAGHQRHDQEPVFEDHHQLRRGRDAVRRACQCPRRKRSVLGASRLGPGKSTTFKTGFVAVGLHPTRTYVRGIVHR